MSNFNYIMNLAETYAAGYQSLDQPVSFEGGTIVTYIFKDEIDLNISILAGLDPEPSPPNNKDGYPIVSTTYGSYPEGLTPLFKSYQFVAVAGSFNIFDIEITSEKRLQGGSYKLWNYYDVVYGDYIEFAVVDKNDVLGLFGSLGLVVGEDILELGKYVRSDYVLNNQTDIKLTVLGDSTLYPGLFLRWIYNSVGNNDIKFIGRIYGFE